MGAHKTVENKHWDSRLCLVAVVSGPSSIDTEVTLSIIDAAVKQIRETAIAAREPMAYYNGDQPLVFLSDKSASVYKRILTGVRDNQCKPIIDLAVDRMRVTGFKAVNETDPIAQAAAIMAWELWQQNRLEMRFRHWQTACDITGRPGVANTWVDSKGRTRVWLNEPQQCAFERNEEDPDELMWLAKRWWDGQRSNITVYTPEEITVWQSMSDMRDPDAATYKQLVEETQVNPLGRVPASAVDIRQSELHDMIPLQNLLNNSIANATISSQYYSLPMHIFLGMSMVENPETGKPEAPFERGTDRDLFIPGADDPDMQPVDVKVVPGQSSHPMLAEADSYRLAMARGSRTPAYLLLQTGEIPSGESLKVSREPFVAKVQAKQLMYGAVIADVMAVAVLLETGALGAEPVELETIWAPASADSIDTDARTVEVLASVGYPIDLLTTKVLGWDSETAQQVADAVVENIAAQSVASARMFDAGLLEG